MVTEWRFGPSADPVTVECVELEEDRHIRLSLSTGARIMLSLERFDEGGTVVHYCECGFGGPDSAQELASVTRIAALMLSDLKALLERGAPVGSHADSLRLPSAA